MKVVLRATIVVVLIAVALAVSWYPWREPDVDIGTSRTIEPADEEAEPILAAPDPLPRPASAMPTVPAADRALADAVVRLVNAERATVRCGALRPDPKLAAAAVRHSADMARRGYLSHDAPDGSDPFERARAAGYPAPTSENIALGYPDASAVMAAWMGSAAHRAPIVDCRAVTVGVGLVRDTDGTPYWTQLLGR
jgi:uncharacterized protein YkwD